MRGGFGQAGRFRHKRSRLIRDKEFVGKHYIGKKGFTSVAQKKQGMRTLNLHQLSDIADRLVREQKAQMEDQKVIIDLKKLGYGKLLGMGSVSRPMRVRVDRCSAEALRKLKEANGEAILSAPVK